MFAQFNSSDDAKHIAPRIGAILTPTDPYWIQALEAIIHSCQKLGDELVILQPAPTSDDLLLIPPAELVDQVLAHNLDALICTVDIKPFLLALLNEGLPIISLTEAELNLKHPRYTAMASLYDGGWMAGEYIGRQLTGRGHIGTTPVSQLFQPGSRLQPGEGPHAVCITAGLEKTAIIGYGRYAGFCDGIKNFPEISVGQISANWSYAQAYPALIEAFQAYPQRIDAMFGVSDTIILAARDAGRRVGVIDDHTLLVGLNGDPTALAAVAEGSLAATIDTASESLGAGAVIMAHRAALGEPVPNIMNQQYQLITRENVASIATRKLIAIADIPNQMVGYSRQQERDRLAQLEISMEITRQIGSLMDRKQMFAVISELVRKYYGYDWMRILRWSKKEQQLVFYEGSLSPAAQQISIDQDFFLHQVFATNETIFIPDLQTSRRWHMGKEWETIHSRAVLPIQLGSEIIGVLDLQSSHPVCRPSLEIVGLKLLASQLGIAIQNSDLYLDAVAAREVAERANQLKTRLVANVGHEMRTPLNAILGFSQAIQKKLEAEGSVPAEELGQDIGRVYKSGEHLMYMINDLLDLSRAEIGALSLYFEPLQPGPFLKELFQSFSMADGSPAQVNWVYAVPENLPMIRADIVRLRQVMINLLANACKYARHGTVTLGAAVELPYLHLWVQDTGQGVPVELQEKIFEPFGTTGRKRRAEGIGLGLSITRHLVSLHDGIITLDSQPGQGSTFHIYLPLPGVTPETLTQPAAGSQPVMLVISGQADIPEDIRTICDFQNAQPRVVTNRDDLNRVLADGMPIGIAWDLASAGPAEWNLISRLSANQKCAALPIILYGTEDGSSRFNPGLTNVVFKPCNGNALQDWIGQLDYLIDQEAPVLVVDDDPAALAYYQDVLRSCYPGKSILLAGNGCQALETLKTQIPALILLDLMMPEMDGFTLLDHIRRDVRTQRVPVVVISGKLLSYEDIQRLNHHKISFLTKGILTEEETADFLARQESETRALPGPTSLLIKQGLAYLHQHYSQPVSRKDIADAVGVSENYLSQIFRQEISISPWDYLSRLRIQKAKELLLQNQDSVTQIALQVGFNDAAYFSRVFHKVTGQSPLDFRQSRTK